MIDQFITTFIATWDPFYVLVVLMMGFFIGWLVGSQRSVRDALIISTPFSILGLVWNFYQSNESTLATIGSRYSLFVLYIVMVVVGYVFRFKDNRGSVAQR